MSSAQVIIVNDSKTINQFLACPSYNAIALDLEGHNLCRHGDIYTIQVFIPSLHIAFIFDCRKLIKSDVVDCFKKIFPSNDIKKYMFDCRSDADALYHQYGLILNNVIDIQLYEIGLLVFFYIRVIIKIIFNILKYVIPQIGTEKQQGMVLDFTTDFAKF